LPLCVGKEADRLVIGHLGQTLDGRIATISGRSQFITSKENLVHAHRLRALCDVVLVGRRTVQEDDPQLTTRLCPGRNAARAIIDPDRRLPTDHQLFRDGAAPTFVFCSAEAVGRAAHHGTAEVVGIEPVQGRLPVQAILAELRRRGLRRIYVEGGGVTVSRFVEAGALTRLHLAVAPVLFGSGRSTLTLPEIDDLSQALVLECRSFTMGRDVMFDCIFAVASTD
jgi:riboflavin-specific deaminase-like protein